MSIEMDETVLKIDPENLSAKPQQTNPYGNVAEESERDDSKTGLTHAELQHRRHSSGFGRSGTKIKMTYGNLTEASDFLSSERGFSFIEFFKQLLYFVAFPISPFVYYLMWKQVGPAALSINVWVGIIGYYIYLGFYFAINPKHLVNEEWYLPGILLVIILIDSSTALAYKTLHDKIASMINFTKAYVKVLRKEGYGPCGMVCGRMSKFTEELMQFVTIVPTERATIYSRDLLCEMELNLQLNQDPTEEQLDKFTFVNYDQAYHRGAQDTVNDDEEDFEHNTAARKTFVRSNLDLDVTNMGESYHYQALHHPDRIKLENMADQIIWGVANRVMGQNGICTRFLAADKALTTLVSLAYLGLIVALPTIMRAGNLDALESKEWFLVLGYCLLMTYFGFHIIAFFYQLIEVYRIQFLRMKTLRLLLFPLESREHCLPMLDFSYYNDVVAWFALRQYVSTFSEKTIFFYGKRLVVFFLVLLGWMGFLTISWARGRLNESTVMTAFTIINFLVFLVYFFEILFFGIFANSEMKIHNDKISDKMMIEHERRLVSHHLDGSAPARHAGQDTRHMLRDLLTFLEHRTPVTLLGLELQGGLVGLIFTGLTTVGGFVVPVLLEAFGVGGGTAEA